MNIPDESNFNPPLGVRGYKYIFIDLDDTIWDFHANAKATLEAIYEDKNLSEYFDSFDQYFDIYAIRNLELWEMYGKGEITKEFLNFERFRHPLAHVGADDVVMAKQIGTEFLQNLPNNTILMPNAIELLEYLYPKYPLTIISNGFEEVQYKKLRNSNLEHYFKHVVLSETAKALKPDKRIFEYAMQLNNAKASECIMIGDSYEADIVGARNAGIDQVWYNTNKVVTKIAATYLIKNPEEIIHIL